MDTAQSDTAHLVGQRLAAAEFAAVAGELAAHTTVADTLTAIVRCATRIIASAEDAAITARRGTRHLTLAGTGRIGYQADAIQFRLGTGPLVDVLTADIISHTDDLTEDGRWPELGRQVSRSTPLRSMIAHRLIGSEQAVFGALSLYARRPGAFSAADLAAMGILATHSSIALAKAADREQNDHLREAVQTNREIGIAIGILMTSQQISRDQAFDRLRVASQRDHRKLRDVALEVLETGSAGSR